MTDSLTYEQAARIGEQTSLFPGENPVKLIGRACEEHKPVAIVCLFSGGNDSTVLAHRCRHYYDSLVFIDTGTAVPGVRPFVEKYAKWLSKPLRVLESGDAYRRVILGLDRPQILEAWGFPDPAGHNRIYNAIKQPQIRALAQELKAGERRARVLALTGIRRAESQRRRSRPVTTKDGNLIYCNPLIDWTTADMHAYRREHQIPQSDAAALLHRSGECNCGCFAGPDERQELETFWPEWFDATIGSLERECKARGIRSCRWGERTSAPPEDAGPLCSDCQLRLDVAA